MTTGVLMHRRDQQGMQTEHAFATLHGAPITLTGNERLLKPPVIVCVLVVPEGTNLTLNGLRDTISRQLFQGEIAASTESHDSGQLIDSWLPHNAAAKHLGISESTLYRYAERRTIESRKFCGRL